MATPAADETLTIVLVHFNTPQATARCVASALNVVRPAFGEAFRIVVVDNRSDPSHFERLQAEIAALAAPEVLLFRNCINAGFGLGCMMALNFSAGGFIAFINSDTEFDTDCFSPLIRRMQAEPAIGVIGPQHLSQEGAPTRSYGFDDGLCARLGRRGKFDPAALPVAPLDVDYVFGAFMMFRREALAQCGGFDPTIFLFYEEMDICQRLRAAGWRIVFDPGASFRHIGQASFRGADTKPESDLALLYVVRKNKGFFSWLALFLAKLVSYALRAPFRARHRELLRRLVTLGPPQASSWRVDQACNFEYTNRMTMRQ
ncbi:GT2 family glycosyltransferase [Rhodoblastus acidophilus]|uniref:glycosyltransferase family 2 protein n=1 Tax=Rhodoblastus acidophilus TaxID=1074 RepID=UPI0022247258|nr:glycosyltransferase family 2 protein [Rhodoblastus acidophilus]MCW2284319.1 GT2 family glycosyltransferase [Rhodoblastus acidophilus]MCW2333203.1 GT2 family glycosyltransferase [Rhodoblastus acidophilus]